MSTLPRECGESLPSIIVLIPGGEPQEHYIEPMRQTGFSVVAAHSLSEVLEAIHDCTPKAIVLPAIQQFDAAVAVLHDLKADHAYGHLPVVMLLAAEQVATMTWDVVHGDDFIIWPANVAEIASRLRLCGERAARDLDANPLTGLPGNLTIMHEAERRIAARQRFALGYIDLDHFKAYNDKYGFTRGDEVLRMTARVTVNAVRAEQSNETYVGHVGGDDFVIMMPAEIVDPICKRICDDFDQIVPNFYDNDDRRARQIQSVDRQGAAKTFPLISCSIAVVDTGASRIVHLGELSARAADLKKLAKAIDGSSYLIDRRK